MTLALHPQPLISSSDLRLLIYGVAFAALIGFAWSVVATEQRKRRPRRPAAPRWHWSDADPDIPQPAEPGNLAPWLDPVEPPQRPTVRLYDWKEDE